MAGVRPCNYNCYALTDSDPLHIARVHAIQYTELSRTPSVFKLLPRATYYMTRIIVMSVHSPHRRPCRYIVVGYSFFRLPPLFQIQRLPQYARPAAFDELLVVVLIAPYNGYVCTIGAVDDHRARQLRRFLSESVSEECTNVVEMLLKRFGALLEAAHLCLEFR